MPEEIFVIALAGIIFGSGLVAMLFYGIYSLIKAKIDKGKSSDVDPQFFKALGEFKKRTERRLTNIEAIVSDLEEDKYLVDDEQKSKSMGEIEIEEEEVRSKDEQKNNGGNLKNMLNE